MITLLMLLLAQETVDVPAYIHTKDGNRFGGAVTLPATIVFKTRTGDVSVDTTVIQTLQQQQAGSWAVYGDISAQGSISVERFTVVSTAGTFTIPADDIQYVQFTEARRVSRPEGPRMTPKFEGIDVRKERRPNPGNDMLQDPLVALSGGRVAVLDRTADTLVVIDEGGRAKAVRAGNGVIGVAESNGKVYVAASRSNEVVVLDAALAVVKRIRVGGPASSVAAAQGMVYALREDGAIVRIDAATDAYLGQMPVQGQGANGLGAWLWVSPDGHQAYVSGSQYGSMAYAVRGDLLVSVGGFGDFESRGLMGADPGSARFYRGNVVCGPAPTMKITQLEHVFAVPHPTKGVIFGARRTGERKNQWGAGDTVVVYGEQSFDVLAEIPVGDEIYGMSASGTTLRVLSRTKLYTLDLEKLAPEAMQKAKIGGSRSGFTAAADAIAKAKEMVEAGWKALASDRAAEAKELFAAAEELDSWSGAAIGTAACLESEGKAEEAIDLLAAYASRPVREASMRSKAAARLGLLLVKAGRAQEALKGLIEAGRRDSGHAELLAALGRTYHALDRMAEAFVAFGASLKAEAGQAELETLRLEAMAKVKTASKARCNVCAGKGKQTVTVTEDGVQKKLTKRCGVCWGAGQVWSRPCPDCVTAVPSVYAMGCGRCQGRRVIAEPWGE